MKKFFLALTVLGAALFATTACNSKDDEGVDGDASIVGTWEVTDADITVKTALGATMDLAKFLETFGMAGDDADMFEEDTPGRVEFTSAGKVNFMEQDEASGKWETYASGSYSLKGNELSFEIDYTADEEEVMPLTSATVTTLTKSKLVIKTDMTEAMMMIFSALAAEDPEAGAMIERMLSGCTFTLEMAAKRI